VALILALAAYPISALLARTQVIKFPAPFNLELMMIVVWTIASFLAVNAWMLQRRYRTDLRDNHVEGIRGRVNLMGRLFAQRGRPRYFLAIEDMRWPIRFVVSLAFMDGEVYTIYYAPHSRMILSAEWLGEGE
jgi:hypothetical protein